MANTNNPSLFTILYVDDEPDNLVTFKATFRRDYNIITSVSGKEALQILDKNTVDLVLTDQRMPEMSGVQLLEKVRDQFPDIVRIIVTGYSDIEAVIGAINNGGVFRYITKPWDERELKMTIENARLLHGLKKDNIQAQFEVLKNQINPHFLFNSFSNLITLIEENRDEASHFVQKLSNVYRYVLLTRDSELTELSNEMDFIIQYLDLLSVRFGDNLKVEISISKDQKLKQVPPLTLQLLVENAIKHNIVSNKKPLSVKISTDENGSLVIRNNLQLKSSLQDSTGIGLKNIQNRYRYFTSLPVIINKNVKYFEVKVPLIEKRVEPKII
jgi:LytS/YehU family sensor histidine kinase